MYSVNGSPRALATPGWTHVPSMVLMPRRSGSFAFAAARRPCEAICRPKGSVTLVSAMVDPDTGNYTLGFLAPGRYKVAYTCDADDVEVDADTDATEDVEFTPADGIAVDVAPNAVTDVDFPPPAP